MTDRRQRVRRFIFDHLHERAHQLGIEGLDLDGDFDFFDSGLIDSLGLVELIDAVATEFDLEVDLSELDPEGFTTVDGLVTSLVGVGS